MLSPRCWLENIAGRDLMIQSSWISNFKAKEKRHCNTYIWTSRKFVQHTLHLKGKGEPICTLHITLKQNPWGYLLLLKNILKDWKQNTELSFSRGGTIARIALSLRAYLWLIWQKQRVRALWQFPLLHKVRMKEKLQSYSRSDDTK